MSKNDIEILLDKIVDCVLYYENTFLYNKLFTLYLGNGEKIRYTINAVNLPHLLGIDLYTLKRYISFKSDDALEILKNLPQYSYDIYKLIRDNILKPDDVFSKFIETKVNNFKSNFKADAKEILEETKFVCSYNSKKSWEVTTNNKKYNYVIVKKLNNGKIALLCLVKNEEKYYAMSNQVYDDTETLNQVLEELISNQEITLLTGINVYNMRYDNNFSRSLTTNQKLDKIDDMKYYKNKYGCYIDISSDYEYTIEKLRSNKDEKIGNKSIIEEIVEGILNRKIIEKTVDSDLNSVIDSWNDYITNTAGENNSISYTETINNLNTFKSLVESLEKENQELEDKNSELEIENNFLNTENKKHIADKEAIMKILKPEN